MGQGMMSVHGQRLRKKTKREKCPVCRYTLQAVYITHQKKYVNLPGVFFCVRCGVLRVVKH